MVNNFAIEHCFQFYSKYKVGCCGCSLFSLVLPHQRLQLSIKQLSGPECTDAETQAEQEETLITNSQAGNI